MSYKISVYEPNRVAVVMPFSGRALTEDQLRFIKGHALYATDRDYRASADRIHALAEYQRQRARTQKWLERHRPR